MNVEDLDKRDDVMLVPVPRDCIGYVTGNRGSSLRQVEEESGTFCFMEGGRGDAEQLLVFGHQKADREVAERLINNLVNEKLRDGDRGGGGDRYDDYDRRDRDRYDDYDRRDRGYDRRDDYDRRDRGRDRYATTTTAATAAATATTTTTIAATATATVTAATATTTTTTAATAAATAATTRTERRRDDRRSVGRQARLRVQPTPGVGEGVGERGLA